MLIKLCGSEISARFMQPSNVLLPMVGWAQLTVSPEVTDFGKVVQGERPSAVVTVANPTSKPIVIRDVIRTCSCADLVLEKRTIAPGERVKATFVLDSNVFDGPFQKTFFLRTEGGPSSAATVKGNIRPRWKVEPSTEIALKEGDNEILALIKDVQNDFMRGKASHVDFLEVRRDQVIKATVAVHAGHTVPVGISQGGLLEQFVHEIEVECLPDALPESVEIDVSKLELDQAMHVSELVLPEGVKAASEGDIVVFHVVDPSKIVEDVPESAAPVDGAAEPEVIGEKERAEKAAAAAEGDGKKKK